MQNVPDKLPLVDIRRRDPVGWREWAVLLLVIVFVLGIWHVDRTAGHAQHAADEATSVSVANRVIGYRNRAAVCDFILEFGGVQPRECLDTAIKAYRDPSITVGIGERRNTTQLLCKILATLKTPATQCAGAG